MPSHDDRHLKSGEIERGISIHKFGNFLVILGMDATHDTFFYYYLEILIVLDEASGLPVWKGNCNHTWIGIPNISYSKMKCYLNIND